MLRTKFIFEFKIHNLLDIINFNKIQIFYKINNEYNFYDDDGILYCTCSIINKKFNGKYRQVLNTTFG
jgi:hypothetical protein